MKNDRETLTRFETIILLPFLIPLLIIIILFFLILVPIALIWATITGNLEVKKAKDAT